MRVGHKYGFSVLCSRCIVGLWQNATILTRLQNADWPRFFSYSPDIWKYLDKVCETFGLRKYMTFNTAVTGCYWNEEKGQWKVKLRQERPGEEPREFEDHCDLLLQGTGILNNYKVS